MADWRPYDHENKKNTTPEADQLVWVIEEQYFEGGVTIGYFDEVCFRTWYGSDDCDVTHWASIEYPDPPS